MKIYMEGYDYKHDIFELVRVFVEDDVEFIKQDEDINIKEIEELIYIDFKDSFIRVNLYKEGKLIDKKEEKSYRILNYNTSKSENIIVKRLIYELLNKEYKKSLPWGILTGIRPTKIVHYLSEDGYSDKTIKEVLETEYKIDLDKINLMLDIKEIQAKHIYPLDNKRYSIYISIPFCPSICSYCSFSSFKINDYSIVKEYVENLLMEIKETGKMMEGWKLNTVYIGGGTPTSIRTEDLEIIIKTIKETFKDENIEEFTVEAGRPDTLNKENLMMLKKQGIDRISINPQTMNNKTLEKVRRNHKAKSIIEKYYLAKEIGFGIINMDVIVGLPGEDLDDIENTIKELVKLDPNNLTIHNLAIKRGSKLDNKNYIEELNKDLDIDRLENILLKYTESIDLKPYYMYRQKQSYGNLENIGYAKNGFESIYNIAMMEEKETIIGLGLGAVSKIYNKDNNSIKRVPNFKGLLEYNTRLDETLSKKELYLQNIK